ncbi:MAG: DUF1697 domain-containing protein [Actinobacteria bacterium]|nr:DUF1697 domain-containing protein [Actinomycetota bacterium]
MRNENLVAVCEDLGLRQVTTVISSGNVVFETDTDDLAGLESEMEGAWRETLGFEATTIIRTKDDLEGLVKGRPFGERVHGPETYLLVTFAKRPLSFDHLLPHRPPDRPYELVAATEREIFTVTNTTGPGTLDVMTWVEREFGREVTSRTWLTVARILKRMS